MCGKIINSELTEGHPELAAFGEPRSQSERVSGT